MKSLEEIPIDEIPSFLDSTALAATTWLTILLGYSRSKATILVRKGKIRFGRKSVHLKEKYIFPIKITVNKEVFDANYFIGRVMASAIIKELDRDSDLLTLLPKRELHIDQEQE